ncbi:MAG TPA: 4-hydroxybenzoyl-CoA reductase subunit alpha [Clostridia bacterium]|nr:4-hydroxybenzoyl-CoA reductase subunit alpha [Clostridia bacterium]
MSDFATIGKPTAMIDSAQKATGQGKYTDDIALPGLLIGKILHSPHPHARIVRLDSSRAELLEGVVCVVTGKDAPNKYGILPVGHDETALAIDRVRYVGDNVACVVAIDEASAERALDLIDVEYELLPAYFDPEEAMKAERDLIHDSRPHNVEKEYHHVFGDPERGLSEADIVHEARYLANEVTHAAMEPHSTIAAFEIDSQTGQPGRLTVWSSTQVPYYLQHTLAAVLEMAMPQVRVIKPLVGGGFGGKSEVIPLEVIAAVAARKAKAPVKITYTREEVFWAHRGRPRTIVDLKIGAKRDGRISAVSARVVQDGGAYCSYGVVTILYSGALLGALYDIPHIRFDGYRVLTNKPACGAMRGHGTVNVRFALECALDEIAARLQLDPAELRRHNLLQPPCVTVNGLRVLSYGLPECMEMVVERSQWRQRRGKLASGRTEKRARGFGLACSHYVSGAANAIIRSDMPHSTVNIKVDRDGAVTVYTGAAEIGQGSSTITAQVVAEVLGCCLGRVRIVSGDSDVTPVDLGSYSSRVTFMSGNAAMRAAESILNQLLAAAARRMGCDPDELAIHDEIIFRRDEAHKASAGAWSMSFDQAIICAIENFGALSASGWYSPPAEARGGSYKGAGVGPSPAYSYSAQVAEVEVDEETGHVTVLNIWAAHDCGRALNPVAVEGQVIGSVWMGLGQALQEEMIWKDGLIMNPGLLGYASPSSAESPHVEAIIVESVDPEGPFGAKEAGEGSLAATIPAIANAIYDAVGVRLNEAPFTPERVLAALRAKDKTHRPGTEHDAATTPNRFREHGGALRISGKGQQRHESDAIHVQQAERGDQ